MFDETKFRHDPDSGNQGGGGNSNQAESASDQSNVEPDKKLVKLTTAQLNERLQRERTNVQSELELKYAGRLLTEEEAREREDRKRAEAEAERKKLEESGHWKEIHEKRQREWELKDKAMQVELESLKGERERLTLDNAVNAAFNSNEVPRIAESVNKNDLKMLFRDFTKMRVQKDGSVSIFQPSGELLYSAIKGRESEPMGVEEALAMFLAERQWAMAPSQSVGTGGGRSGGGGRVLLPANWETDAVYATLTPEQKQLARDAYYRGGNNQYRDPWVPKQMADAKK